MLKNVFFIFLSMLGTVLFVAFFVYIFANSVQMVCVRQPDNTFTCAIEKKLLDRVTTSRHTVSGVTAARIVESCDEGCSYRVDLLTATGGSQPFDDVYTDYEPMRALADQINTQIKQHDGSTFSVKEEMQGWVLILLVGLALLGLGIELIFMFGTVYRWVVNR